MSDAEVTEAQKKKDTRVAYIKKHKIFQIYDTNSKKMKSKAINLDQHSVEEADKMGLSWLEQMKAKINGVKEEAFKSVIKDAPFNLPRDKESGISICMIASTRAGKTTLLDHILENYFQDHICVLFSNSLQSKAYDQIKKNCISSPLYHHQIIKDEYKINKETKNKFEFLNILDDVVDEKNDKELMKALTIYRNSRLSMIICAQSPIIMNSTGRGNINYVLLGRCNSDETIEKVIKKYCLSYFPSEFKMVDKIKHYRQLVEDYHFLMIDNINDTICRIKIAL